MTISFNTYDASQTKQVIAKIAEEEGLIFSNSFCATGSAMTVSGKKTRVDIYSNFFSEKSLNEIKEEMIHEFGLGFINK